MTVHDETFLAGFASAIVEQFIARVKEEGLYHDDRPPLTLEQAAARLNVSRRVLGDMIKPGPNGEPAALATIKVIPGGHKGWMVECAEIDRYLAAARRAGRDGV